MAELNGLATTLYTDKHFGREAVKLLPGEFYVTSDARLMCTVLGSCVAACIRDPVAGIAGMNHFLLPVSGREDDSVSARYGVHAMELLINTLLKGGARRERLEVKLFGGGNLLRSRVNHNVGHANARFAEAFAEEERLSVLSRDLYGDRPRKIWYFPETGRVMLRRLTTTRNDTILRREVDFGRRLSDQTGVTAGDVELFD